jgi:hypothetical protein
VKFDIDKIWSFIIKTITQNNSVATLEIGMEYFYLDREKFNEEIARSLINYENQVSNLSVDFEGEIEYYVSDSIEELISMYDVKTDTFNLEEIPNSDFDREDMMIGQLEDLRSALSYEDDDDEDYEKNPKRKYRQKKNKKPKSYLESDNSSKLMGTKEAKDTIKNFDIIISSDKKALKRDRNLIEDLIKKHLIPGKRNIDKYYQKRLLDRWMAAFAISEKEAKKIDKSEKKARRGISKEQAVRVMKKVLQRRDPFYDPNR